LSSCRQLQIMNYHKLTIFFQNVQKNKTLTDIILEMRKANTNVIFIQEPPRFLRRYIPSHTNPEGNPVYGVSLHPNWTLFACYNNNPNNIPRVITYINQQCKKLWFTLRNDIIDHYNINVVLFHNGQNLNFIIDVYSDDQQQALQALCDALPLLWLGKMAKSLFIFLFFSFSFSFILDLLHRREYRKVLHHKCHIVTVTWQEVTASHHMMSHDTSHDGHGKVVHRPYGNCISSVENLIGTLSSSPCQTLIKEQLALF